jgi:hypothetical protein
MLRERGNLGIAPAGRGLRSIAAHNSEPWYHVSRATLDALVTAGVATWRSSYPDAAPNAHHYIVAS